MIPDSSTRVLWQLPAETPGIETGETWREMSVNLTTKYLSLYFMVL
jgi:hypothetical protein